MVGHARLAAVRLATHGVVLAEVVLGLATEILPTLRHVKIKRKHKKAPADLFAVQLNWSRCLGLVAVCGGPVAEWKVERGIFVEDRSFSDMRLILADALVMSCKLRMLL